MDRLAAFEDLVRATTGDARRCARRYVRVEAVADEAVAEAYLAVWRDWDRLREHPEPRAMVLARVRNLAISALRRETRQERLVTRAQQFAGRTLPERARDLDVVAALASLPARQRQVACLMHAYGFEEGDLAELLGIGRGSVKTHAHRARAALRAALDAAPLSA